MKDRPRRRLTTRIEAADFFEGRDEALRAHATQIDDLNAFMDAYGLDKDMQYRVREYFYQTRHLFMSEVRVMGTLCEAASAQRSGFEWTDERFEMLMDGNVHAQHTAQVITNLLDVHT